MYIKWNLVVVQKGFCLIEGFKYLWWFSAGTGQGFWANDDELIDNKKGLKLRHTFNVFDHNHGLFWSIEEQIERDTQYNGFHIQIEISHVFLYPLT